MAGGGNSGFGQAGSNPIGGNNSGVNPTGQTPQMPGYSGVPGGMLSGQIIPMSMTQVPSDSYSSTTAQDMMGRGGTGASFGQVMGQMGMGGGMGFPTISPQQQLPVGATPYQQPQYMPQQPMYQQPQFRQPYQPPYQQQPQQPAWQQSDEWKGYQTQMSDLQNQLNQSPIMQQLQALQGKMQGYQQQYTQRPPQYGYGGMGGYGQPPRRSIGVPQQYQNQGLASLMGGMGGYGGTGGMGGYQAPQGMEARRGMGGTYFVPQGTPYNPGMD